jgi:hypothetical protein
METIRCENRTLEIGASGGMDELLEAWAAGPLPAELMAPDPNRAQKLRNCVWGQLHPFVHDDLLWAPPVARLTLNRTYAGLIFWLTRNTLCGSC